MPPLMILEPVSMGVSIFSHHVIMIVLVCTGKEMVWVHAGRIVAAVKHE